MIRQFTTLTFPASRNVQSGRQSIKCGGVTYDADIGAIRREWRSVTRAGRKHTIEVVIATVAVYRATIH